MRIGSAAIASVLCLLAAAAAADTLAKVRDTGRFVIGFREQARPFAFRDEQGEPAGYSVDLCRVIAEAVRLAVGRDDVAIEFAPVPADRRIQMLKSGDIDIECGSSTHTLERRREVSFTLSTFVTGAEMLLPADSAIAGFEDLAGKTVGVLQGTTTEEGLRGSLEREGIDAEVRTVAEHDEGLQMLRDGKIDAYFADRILLFGLLRDAPDGDAFKLSGNFFSYEPYAFMVRRGDDDLRLIADGTLSDLYRSGKIWELFAKHFPDTQPSDLLAALFILEGVPVR